MNNLEDRLRDAYRGAAKTVRPEQVPAPRWAREQAARREPPARRPAWRTLAPVAAAAAVAVVAVSSAVVLPRMLAGTGTTPAPGTPAPATSAGPPPKFMVIAASAGSLQVQVAATGRVVSAVPTPQATLAWTAAAAVTGSTFVLAAQPATGPQPGACYTLLYTLTLTAAGSPASLTPLDVPRLSGSLSPGGFAASADGMVAYSWKPCPGTSNGTTTIGVIDTATKQTRQWTIPSRWFIAGGLALSADGRVLALSIPDSTPVPPSVWALPTDSAPGPITQRARRVITPPGNSQLTPSVLISADGSTVYVLTYYMQTPRQYASTVAAYDVATGALLRIVRTGWHLLVSGISADPGMDHAVAWSDYSTEPAEIDLATGQVRTPPASLPHGAFTEAAAW